jgi:rhamnopyranosyl-N-acetylglucosaminyl-diphospho-decaprenol beta-1,3/1,4-galactofuranosyltransferase
MIAIAMITHNRVGLLRQCVENVLARASQATTEIVIWDNASTDGTAEYLKTLTDPRITVVNSTVNVGMNGYARGFQMTAAPYFVDLDDDVVDAPQDWDRILLDAYRRVPEVGFLAADLVQDPYDPPSRLRHHARRDEYHEYSLNGVRLIEGPTGGWCAITERVLAERAGGFRERPGEVFWLEDAEYVNRLAGLGYRAAILADLRVHHTGGARHAYQSPEKLEVWRREWRRVARRQTAKRVLLGVPLVAQLNARYGWFQPPDPERKVEEAMRPPGRDRRGPYDPD